jgi:hypothetical protein
VPKSRPGEYDRRDDYDVWRGLGIRLGQEQYWPWKDLDEAQDYRLKNFDMTLDEFAWKKGWDTEPIEFKSYEKEVSEPQPERLSSGQRSSTLKGMILCPTMRSPLKVQSVGPIWQKSTPTFSSAIQNQSISSILRCASQNPSTIS